MTFGLGRLGTSFGKMGAGNTPSTPDFPLAAPALVFASATTPSNDNTQDFNATFTDDIEGKFIRLVGTFGSATVSEPYDIDVSEEIDATEADAFAENFTTGAIDDGVCSFKCRIQDAADSGGTALSNWSNTVSKTIDTTAATITSATTANNAENSVLVHALTANESVTWALNGGADVALFEVSGSTLRWASNGTQDFETPLDAGANNVYNVTVRATDTAGNTTDQNIAITVTDVAEESAEVSQYLARATGMDATHVNAFTALIDGLVADGIWAKLDCLYILATDTEAHAKLNIKSSSFTITENGTVTFTADRGYTQTDADLVNYLNSTFNPSTAGGNFVRDSAHGSIWCNTNQTSAVGALGASDATNSAIAMTIRNGADQFITRVNQSVASNMTVGSQTSATGHWVTSRTGASVTEAYRNGASIGTDTDASTALINLALGVGGRNSNGTFGAAAGQYSAASFGGGLDDTEAAALHSRISTYRTAVGL